MELDLSVKGELSIDDSVLIDVIAPRVQEKYNQLIEQIVRENALDGLHLLLSVCSRNPFHSSILPLLCRILLLEEKLKRGDKVTLIIVDRTPMFSIIHSILDKFDQKIPIKVNQKYSFILFILLVCFNFLKSVYRIIISWLWPRLTGVYKKQPKGSIVFVDNFILLNSFNKEGEFIDRYYTGYDDFLSSGQRQKIFYSPTLHGFRTLGQCLKMSIQSKRSQDNFLFQESWLILSDYIHALYLTAVLPFKVKKSPLFLGNSIHKLLVSETRKDIFSSALLMAICKFKFIKNLKSAGVEICQVVDWHENQNIDKALNLSFHQYYPSVVVKGYQGYVSPLYETHKIPQPFELESSILPSQLHVISEEYKKIILDSCPELDVRVASAFRFSYLYNINRKELTLDIPTVLIALPMDVDESVNILNACSKLHTLINTKINILVKCHPTYESHVFSKKVPEFLNDAFMPTNDSTSDLLNLVSLVISSASSVCVEAESLGIPVAIHGNRYGITMDPMNGIKDNIFYSQGQLSEFVNNSLVNNICKIPIDRYFFTDNGESAQELFVCEQCKN